MQITNALNTNLTSLKKLVNPGLTIVGVVGSVFVAIATVYAGNMPAWVIAVLPTATLVMNLVEKSDSQVAADLTKLAEAEQAVVPLLTPAEVQAVAEVIAAVPAVPAHE